jgi:hypothetical protein
MSDREQRGLAIAALYRIENKGGKWLVPSQTGNDTIYEVDPDPDHPHCSCPDHQDRGVKCKHMFAVEFTLTRERCADGSETITRTFTVSLHVNHCAIFPLNDNLLNAQRINIVSKRNCHFDRQRDRVV